MTKEQEEYIQNYLKEVHDKFNALSQHTSSAIDKLTELNLLNLSTTSLIVEYLVQDGSNAKDFAFFLSDVAVSEQYHEKIRQSANDLLNGGLANLLTSDKQRRSSNPRSPRLRLLQGGLSSVQHPQSDTEEDIPPQSPTQT